MQLAFFTPISNGALNSEELPDKIKLLDFGRTDSVKGPVIINQKSLSIFDANQKQMGRVRVPLDFDHATVEGTKAYEESKGMPKPIAAYGTAVIGEDGLWLKDLKWTPMGKEFAKNYEDLSPTPLLDDNNTVIGLHSVALCPAGAIEKLTFFSADDIFKTMKEEKPIGAEKSYSADIEDEDEDDEDAEEPDEDDNFDKQVHKKHLEEYDTEDHYSKYGDVEYADKENHKYPVDTKEHARAASAYINMPKNASKYSGDKLSQIKSNIKAAVEKHGIEVSGDKTKTKAMSVDMPDAYKNTTPNEVTQNIKYMTEVKAQTEKVDKVLLGAVPDAEARKRLIEALLAVFDGVTGEEAPITNKDNSKLHEFSAGLATLTAKVVALEAKSQADVAKNEETEKGMIVLEASKNGKFIPLSADAIKATPVAVLRELVSKLPKEKVPMKQTMRALNADGKPTKITRADSARILNELIAVK